MLVDQLVHSCSGLSSASLLCWHGQPLQLALAKNQKLLIKGALHVVSVAQAVT
jgi:hypothetical protein